MSRLRLRTNISAPVDDCYRLALTIPVQERALVKVAARAASPDPGRPLVAGETVTWSARWLHLPWRMTTRIVATRPPAAFIDEQVSGPFGHWHHEHRFTACDGGTLMEDDVDWSAPFGIAGDAAVVLGIGRFVTSILRDHNARLAAQIVAATSTIASDPPA